MARILLAGLPLLLVGPVSCFEGFTALAPFPCAEDGSCPSNLVCVPGIGGRAEGQCLPWGRCDVNAQDCVDPERPKCGRVLKGTSIVSTCIPEMERKGEQGDACTYVSGRSGKGGYEYAYDDCAAGFGCSHSMNICRAYCTKTSDCGPKEVCLDSGSEGIGFCQPGGCSFFTTTASTAACEAGWTCKAGTFLEEGMALYCVPEGVAGPGAPCTGGCRADLVCSHGVCSPLCDAMHACGSGRKCDPIDNHPTGVGVCSCSPFSDDCGANGTCIIHHEADEPPTYRCSKKGEIARDQSCRFRSDECGDNLVCLGSDEIERFVCREQCGPGHDCSAGTCHQLGAYAADQIGLCHCDLREPTCPDGQSCKFTGSSSAGVLRACSPNGSKTKGEACSNGECGDNLKCWGSSSAGHFCHEICDTGHPCSDGSDCGAIKGLRNGGGLCPRS